MQQVKQIYKLSPDRLAEVFKRFGKGLSEQFSCTYRKVLLVGYEVSRVLGTEIKKPFRDVIMEFQSEWEYEGTIYEPF